MCLQVNPNEFFCHPVPLGDNLYSKDRSKVVPPPRGAGAQGDKQQQAEQQVQNLSTDGNSGRVSVDSYMSRKVPAQSSAQPTVLKSRGGPNLTGMPFCHLLTCMHSAV